MAVHERRAADRWEPPWLRFQHVARYEWARGFCSGKSALDAACGNGYGSQILRSAGRVVSLDLADEAIDEARRTTRGLRLLYGDTTRLPLRTASFDTFVSFETIEHVADDAAYVREARRVVKPDGVFLCSTPNRALVNPGNTIDDPPFNRYHVREYTAVELSALLQRSFAHVRILGQSGFSRPYAHVLRAVGRASRHAGVRLHQLRKLATVPLERRDRHEPREFGDGEVPEVLIAVCSGEAGRAR